MARNVLLLAYMPLSAALIATHTYGLAAVVLLSSYLLWNDFHKQTPVPKPLQRTTSGKKSKDEVPFTAIVAMAYIPLMAALISHNSSGGLGIRFHS